MKKRASVLQGDITSMNLIQTQITHLLRWDSSHAHFKKGEIGLINCLKIWLNIIRNKEGKKMEEWLCPKAQRRLASGIYILNRIT